jgi:hypothetical protein
MKYTKNEFIDLCHNEGGLWNLFEYGIIPNDIISNPESYEFIKKIRRLYDYYINKKREFEKREKGYNIYAR